MKYIILILHCFAFSTVLAQSTTTTILDLPTPDGIKIQKILQLPTSDTTIVVSQEVDKTTMYKYTIRKKSDTMYVYCVFIVRGKESTCDFKVQLKTDGGQIVPQRQQQSAILKNR